jgi:anti-sigma factor RsiW
MNHCPSNTQLELLHDGELADAIAAELHSHVAVCEVCAKYLAELSSMSRQLAGESGSALLPIQLQRLHCHVDKAIEQTADRGLIRMSWILSAIAAGVLVVGSVWLERLNQAPQVAPPWVGLSATGDSVVRDAETPAAQWYLADALETRSALADTDFPGR